MTEQTYDEGRARNLQAMLRAFSERIRDLDDRGELLKHSSELMRAIGEIRSELFHYEVRITYDTPAIAESRRIVREATDNSTDTWRKTTWDPESPDQDPDL